MNRISALFVKKYAVQGAKDPTARSERLARRHVCGSGGPRFSRGSRASSARDLMKVQAAMRTNAPPSFAAAIAG
jgi:hypothetical protein